MAVMARGLPTLRLTPTTAMEAMVDTVSATPLATVLATAMAVMARGLPTLRLMPTTVMAVMVATEPTPLDTGLAMVMAATARGPPTPRLMPTMAMEDMVDTVLATPLDTDLVTVDTAMAVLAMPMASKH